MPYRDLRRLVMNGDYVVGQHASERLEERGLLQWQAVVGMDEAGLIAEDESAIPNPKVEVSEPPSTFSPDASGVGAHVDEPLIARTPSALRLNVSLLAVWSLLKTGGVAKFVTVHFFDEE